MTAAELIRRATEAGVEMAVGQDGRLLLRAERQPSADLLADLTAHKVELVELLVAAANDPMPSSTWLWLLLQDSGEVIQCGITGADRPVFGVAAARVEPVAVPGVERLLAEEEIVKALAGTLAAPASPPPPSSVWLARVARLLGTRPAELLEGGHLEQHDLAGLAGTDASQVADTIRSSPAWINRPQPVEQPVERIVEEEVEPQRFTRTAATASAAWQEADAAYTSHLMTCRACHAATGRYCAAGADLRQRYDNTPMD
ncbi:hypothetical protein [Pseudomonas sp. NW5]|uniref:hypothetical protein n=1 Tax=Pseudomonas sp. NW5 TaxID=2934934 RepID=UPI0020205416|nr:hypothetical protein [Pseudomonas sp. NW5]MCL7462204.1 hypothetical protein [Pseudomonas sp. NW5]